MDNIIWKGFKLGSIFEWSKRKDLSLKNYNMINSYEDGYVEVITGSMNSINDFISKEDLPKNYPIYKDCLTLSTNGSIGYCFYYPNEIVSPTSSVHILIHKNDRLERIMTPEVNSFFAKLITHIFTSSVYNRITCLIDNDKFDREIIILPLLEVNSSEEYIWEENGHYYTLPINYISYQYYSGKINHDEKIIKNYC